MKYSIYNLVFPISDELDLLYNSFSDTFLIVKSSVKELLKDSSFIKEHHKALYKSMVESECYVHSDLNEFERLKKLSDGLMQNTSTYFLMINPTLNCNLNCWYCYENHIPKSFMDADVYDRVLSFIGDILDSNIKQFSLGFFGGEPLLGYSKIVYPLVEHVANECKERKIDFDISFTSNGTLITEDMIISLLKHAPVSFQITLDGNEETHNNIRFFKNKKGTYKLIFENIKILLKYGCKITLRINYTIDNLPSINQILGDLNDIASECKNLIFIDFHRVWQDNGTMALLSGLKQTVDSFIESGYTVRYNDLNGITDACYADKKNTALINYNGDVFKCTARDFIKENRDGYLNENGKIIWEKSQEYRLALKLKNKPCHTCSIAPLCGGGCTRYILEKEVNGDYCLFSGENEAVKEVIFNRFESVLRKNQ